MKLTKHAMIPFILFLLMIVPVSGFAQGGNIQIGNLKIIPSINAQAAYDDNIYMKNGTDDTSNKIVRDWIYHLMPGIMLSYTFPERGRVNLGYQGDWAFYNSNTSNNWKSQKVLFDLNYEAPGGIILALKNTWMDSEDPFGSADQYAVGRVTKRWTDDFKGKAGYNFGKVFKVLMFYNFYKQEYKDQMDYAQNYANQEFGAGIETRIFSKTWGFVRYHYGLRNYNTFYDGLTADYNSDFNYHRVNAGLTWDASAKITGEINFGYLWKRYKNEYVDALQSARRENQNTWVAATAVTYKPFETTGITLTIDRALRDSNANTNEYFEDTGVGLSLRQTFFTKFVLMLGAQYSLNDYNLPAGNARRDHNYTGTAALDYNIQKWLTVGVSYKYARKDSNYVANEYRDNQGMVSVKVAY